MVDTLSAITAQQAAAKKYLDRNSIWEIANHLIAWRITVLERVKGIATPTPEHNYFLPVKDTSENAWAKTMSDLENSQQLWINFLQNFEDSELSNISKQNGFTHYEHIHGIIQHDVYHLGQIVLLAKHPE